jgi:hypothetical protein
MMVDDRRGYDTYSYLDSYKPLPTHEFSMANVQALKRRSKRRLVEMVFATVLALSQNQKVRIHGNPSERLQVAAAPEEAPVAPGLVEEALVTPEVAEEAQVAPEVGEEAQVAPEAGEEAQVAPEVAEEVAEEVAHAAPEVAEEVMPAPSPAIGRIPNEDAPEQIQWSCVECQVALPWGSDWRQEGEDFYCTWFGADVILLYFCIILWEIWGRLSSFSSKLTLVSPVGKRRQSSTHHCQHPHHPIPSPQGKSCHRGFDDRWWDFHTRDVITLEVNSDSATEQLGQGQHGPGVEARTAAGQVVLRLLAQQLGELTSDTRQGRCVTLQQVTFRLSPDQPMPELSIHGSPLDLSVKRMVSHR